MFTVKLPGCREINSWCTSGDCVTVSWEEWYKVWKKRSKYWAFVVRDSSFLGVQTYYVNTHRRIDDLRHDLNELSAVPWTPNPRDQRFKDIAWWVVSKVGQRSSKQRQATCWRKIALIRWSWSERQFQSNAIYGKQTEQDWKAGFMWDDHLRDLTMRRANLDISEGLKIGL